MMAKKVTEPTTPARERAYMVGVEIYGQEEILSVGDSLLELSLLADTAGLTVVGQTIQKLDHPYPETYIGTGKVEEIIALVEETAADVVLFDCELSPRHQSVLVLQ
jgi:GTP-binding protein HflX